MDNVLEFYTKLYTKIWKFHDLSFTKIMRKITYFPQENE